MMHATSPLFLMKDPFACRTTHAACRGENTYVVPAQCRRDTA